MDTLIKRLIWLYFFLLVGEGVLRKWVLPGLSAPLLIVRDPVVFAIYVAAIANGRFPFGGAILFLLFLFIGSIAFSVMSEAPPIVVLYGLRINYFHLPLIYIMADILNREDLIRMGRAVLYLTLPISILMILQFKAGSGSWLNAGAGGDLDSQLRGALGKVRPPGPFTFITGPILWYSLATAYTLYGWIKGNVYPRWLLGFVTCLIVIIVPISISRTLMLSVLVVVAFGGLAVLRHPQRALSIFGPLLLAAITYAVIGNGELTEAFASRWQSSTSSGFESSIIDRFFSDHLGGLDLISSAPLFGHGIGMGSNVGAHFTTGQMGFQLAESEWAKIVLELGPILGWGFILFRCWLTGSLLLGGWKSITLEKDSLAWLLCGACILPVISGQWAPPTILGFAVFGAGLAFAAAKSPPPGVEADMVDEIEDLETEADNEPADAAEENLPHGA
jgi:hypothetical protein